MIYIANGIVVGDLWGLPGREHNIEVAQHQARISLLSSLILQFCVAGAMEHFLFRNHSPVEQVDGDCEPITA